MPRTSAPKKAKKNKADVALGRRIRRAIDEIPGLRDKTVADAIDVAPANFSAALRGRVGFQVHHLQRLSMLTGKSVAWLLGLPERPDLVRVPVYGLVTAGKPVPAEADLEKVLDLPAHLLPRGKAMALRVSGDSMIGAGIRDRDIVIMRVTDQAAPGDIVAASYDGDTALRRLVLKDGHFFLKAESDGFQPVEIRRGTVLHIHGVLTCLIRQYEEVFGASGLPASSGRFEPSR